jgi:DNA polymerase III beta subunit
MASFTVKTSRLRDALTPLSQILPKKTHRDALKCIRITANSGDVHSLQLMATDLEVFAISTINDEEDIIVNNSGEFIVPALTILEYLKAIEDETITISYIEDDDLVKVFAGQTEFEVGTQELDEFPKFPSFPTDDDVGWIELPIESLNTVLSKVLFSVADKGHPRFGALNAVCIESSKDKLSFMSTDQVRASIAHFDISLPTEKQVLVDPKGLDIIPKLFSDNPKMHMASDDATIFCSDNTKLFIRNINGKFPSVANFIPTPGSYPNHFAVTPQELLKEVRKAALAADQNKTLKILLGKNKMQLSTKTRRERRFAKIDVVIPYSGPETKFSINCKLLIDLLKAADTHEDIEIWFNGSTDAIHFKQDHYDHIVVPL